MNKEKLSWHRVIPEDDDWDVKPMLPEVWADGIIEEGKRQYIIWHKKYVENAIKEGSILAYLPE